MARLLETEPVVIDDDLPCGDEEGPCFFMNLKEPTISLPEQSTKEDRRFFNRKRQMDDDEGLNRRIQREVERQVIDVDDIDSDVEYLYSRPANPARFPPAKRRVEEWPTLPTLSSLSPLSSAYPTLPTLHPPLVPSVPACSPAFLPSEHTSTPPHSGFPMSTTSTSTPSTTTTTTTSSSLFPSSLSTFPPLPSLSSISVSIQALPAGSPTQRSISSSSPSQPHNHSHVHVHLHPRPMCPSPRLPSFHEFELHERAAEQLVMEAANSAKNQMLKLVADMENRKAETQPPRSFTSGSSVPASSPNFSNSTLPPLPLFPSIIPHSTFVPSPSLFHAHVHSHTQAHAHSQLPHHHHSAFMPAHSPHQSIFPHSHPFSTLHPNHSFRSFHGNLGPLSHVTTLELVCSPFGSLGDDEDESDYDDIEGYETASDLDDDEEDYFASSFDHPHYVPFRGADEKTILNLPITSYEVKDVNNVDICSICIEEFSQGNPVKRLPRCQHVFHISCIDTWLGINKICPTCRTEIA